MKAYSTDEETNSARIAFGHIPGRTDEECLCLRIQQLRRLLEEAKRVSEMHIRRSRVMERELERAGVDLRKIAWGSQP